MNPYNENRSWSDKYIPTICNIVGPYLLTPSDFKKDTKQATDLLVLDARDMRIAARVRRASKYIDRYRYEFTLRSKVGSGASTEMEKIVNGLGDWLFYGFAEEDGIEIKNWWIIDLAAFRAALIRRNEHKLDIDGPKSNGDGTQFYAFDLRSFPEKPSILIAGSHALPAKVAA